MSVNNSNTIAAASLVNNEGAHHFSKGNFDAAMLCYRQSLQSVISIVNQSNPTPATEASANASPLLPVSSTAIAACHISAGFKRSLVGSDGQDFEKASGTSSNECFVFENPIVFEDIFTQHQEAILIFCGVVVFNMAITAHAKSKNDSSYLVKALALYDGSIDFFLRANNQGALFSAVVAAALNNKINIYYGGNQYEDLERDTLKLKKAMANANLSQATANILHAHEFEGILINAMFFKRPVVAEAA